ncbi:hypothetical protein BHE74_00022471 [Ensete ventricosum]|nr:hypothetical protein GW17_00060831 [Ensete ventricosum]RWW69891.1 hypothetical protein BHE74_00022471 [Ensete ventricosum]RZS16269.1 hypothetical protein BHM03_00048239 [Ensete ventricosum]
MGLQGPPRCQVTDRRLDLRLHDLRSDCSPSFPLPVSVELVVVTSLHCDVHGKGVELCERLTTLGIAVNLVTYLTGTMHLGSAASANAVTNFLGTSFMLCLLGGFVADTFLGRYPRFPISIPHHRHLHRRSNLCKNFAFPLLGLAAMCRSLLTEICTEGGNYLDHIDGGAGSEAAGVR